jgi:hypothetical protein
MARRETLGRSQFRAPSEGGLRMFDYERLQTVHRLIFDHVRSPSLRHIRDPHSVDTLAKQIIKAIDREPTVWHKWEGQREELLRAAACCWVPHEELQGFFNAMPGLPLTLTDVAQRLRAIHEEPYTSYPSEVLREGCLALFEREKALGTELPAIIGALQGYVEQETERRRVASEAAYRQRQVEKREALDRFLARADCKWTPIQKSKEIFRRINGRAYKLSPTKDKKWELFRTEGFDDPNPPTIGRYANRGDVTKALSKLAYEPEPRW